MHTVLIIETERFARAATVSALNAAGYNTVESDTMASALKCLQSLLPNAAIIDYELPDGDSLELFAQLQQNQLRQRIPCLMLTAGGDDRPRITCLEAGADDVMSKPVSLSEMVLRLNNMIAKRQKPSISDGEFNISSRGINLDMQSLQVSIAGENTDLSLSEFRLLYHFMRNPNKAFSRSELRKLTKGDEAKLDERSIDVYVMRLRKSLQKRGYQDLIQTVRGIGYRFNA